MEWDLLLTPSYNLVTLTLSLVLPLCICSYIYLYADYLWDDFTLARGGLKYYMKLRSLQNSNGVYDPAQRLEEHAVNRPDKVFMLFEDEKFTFSQTNIESNRAAWTLKKLGVTREQKLAILMNNKPDIIFILHGCLKLTIPLSFINTNLRNKSLLHCINDASTKNLLVDNDPELIEAVNEIHSQLEDEGIRVFVYGSSDKHMSFTDSMVGAQNTNPDPAVRKDISYSDDAVYVFTSGTTGLPKAVRITYRRYERYPAMFYMCGLKDDDIFYCPLPFFHGSSLLGFTSTALFTGISFSFARKFSVTEFWKDCVKYNATVIQYIGETCRYLQAAPPTEYDQRHRVRLAVGNGLRSDIWESFVSRFQVHHIFEFYASTEGNVFFANIREKVGSCGRLSPFTKRFGMSRIHFLEYDYEKGEVVRGVDGFCKIVARGQPGLLVAGINKVANFDGYTNKKETAEKILKNVEKEGDIYYNTGDVLLWDHDYQVYFVDRVGDTFRWKGENVSTQELATILDELGIVLDCAVYGVSIPGMDGKCGMAALALKSGTKPNKEILKSIYDHCAHTLPSYARPVFIRFMSELSLTETYKHRKLLLCKEGFDIDTVADVYVYDKSRASYIALTSELQHGILNGTRRV